MNPSPEVKTALKRRLRMSGVLRSLEQRNQRAIDGQLASPELLAMLLQDERARRDQKRLRTRLARSGSAVDNTLETFDLDRLLNSNRLHIHDFCFHPAQR